MTAKNEFWVTKDKQQSFVNDNSQITDNANQYSNLNLNQNHKSPILIPVQSSNKSYNDKICFFTIFDSNEETEKSQTWNPSNLNLKTLTVDDKVKEVESEMRWKKNNSSNTNNNSTLSLHIAAYENSSEAVALNLFGGKNNAEKFETKNIKQSFIVSTFVIQNPFEFPRQQNDNAVPPEPEVSQFKASQKLLNPNKSRKKGNKLGMFEYVVKEQNQFQLIY
uniref:Uncharacterized protein n=1 Tax=Panagrolaimus sp. PS1159 TaxID=55785 RepID=A0AC35FM59_9BILA